MKTITNHTNVPNTSRIWTKHVSRRSKSTLTCLLQFIFLWQMSGNAFGQTYNAPYDIPRFQAFMGGCKLQAPTSSTAATQSQLVNGYTSSWFYVADGDKVAFNQSGSLNRTELRHETNWTLSQGNRSLHARINIVHQTCDQVTVLQIHDDANAGSGPNKPLLRIYKHQTKSPVNHLWAAYKTDAGGSATSHIDLGLAPTGYFNCDIRLVNGNMIIDVDGVQKANVNVSFWTFPSYWKAGVYLQDAGEATAYFDELYAGDGSPGTGGNSSPTTSITSPVNGAGFTAGSNITITANASDTDGTISKVEFFQGATKLGEDLSFPYSYTWNNVSAGNFNLTSVATDNQGATGTSSVVSISVNSGGGGSWTEISNENFESGWGIWNDGGSDASLYTSATHAHQGTSALNIQDNTSSSVVSTDNLSLSAYTDLKLDFWFKAVSMENGEDFWLQVSTDGGSNYTTVKSWVITSGSTYENNNFYQESVELLGYGLSNQTRIRFRCDASDNGDDIYLDEIVISAKGSGARTTSESEPSQALLLQSQVSRIYPNPVKGKMLVEYELADDSHVIISVLNLSGQVIAQLENGPRKAGAHALEWNALSTSGAPLPKDMYLVRFNLNGENQVRRILISE